MSKNSNRCKHESKEVELHEPDMIDIFESGQTLDSRALIEAIELQMNAYSVDGTALEPHAVVSPVDDNMTTLRTAVAEHNALCSLTNLACR